MFTRRNFLKTSLGISAMAGAVTQPNLASAVAKRPDPTAAQAKWMNLRYGMFIHFGPNTLAGVGWGDGKFPAQNVSFPKLDIRQWAAVARDAGMKYAVLTTKHHDGFCLWPSNFTEYCVKNTPERRDIVGEYVRAFQDAGLKTGFYYSIWDVNCPFYNEDARYAQYMRNQVEELTKTYGPSVEWWFDGSWDKDHPTREWMFDPAWENDPKSGLGHGERYEWKQLYEHLHMLDPETIILHNSSSDRPGKIRYLPCDARTAEHFDFVMHDRIIEPVIDPIVTVGDSSLYLPLEFETSITPSWFWKKADFINHPSVATIADWYSRSRKANANLLLNVGPDANGLIPDYNAQFLHQAAKLMKL